MTAMQTAVFRADHALGSLSRKVTAREMMLKTGGHQGGQALVEFALTIPIFILLLLGFLGMAVILFSFLTANEAARDGSRYVIADPTATDSEVRNYICQKNSGLGGGDTNCLAMLGAGSLTITVEPDVSHRVQNGQLAVTVAYRVPLPTLSVGFLDRSSFTFLGPIWVSGVSVMRFE
jgi:Flp pilus assembly protein TadG